MVKQSGELSLTQLQQQKAQVQQEIMQLQQRLQVEVDVGQDEADPSLSERSVTVVLLSNARQKLVAIEHALDQVQSGSYGICEACEQAIDPDRLAIFPEATLCVQCQSEQER